MAYRPWSERTEKEVQNNRAQNKERARKVLADDSARAVLMDKQRERRAFQASMDPAFYNDDKAKARRKKYAEKNKEAIRQKRLAWNKTEAGKKYYRERARRLRAEKRGEV